MQTASRRLGEFLIERKVLSRDTLEEMLEREAAEGVPLSRMLAAEGMVAERDLLAGIAHQIGMRYVDLGSTPIHPMVDKIVPVDLAKKHLAVAVEVEGADLVVAMANPGDKESVGDLEQATGWPIIPALAARGDLTRVLTAMYGTSIRDDEDIVIPIGDDGSSASGSASPALEVPAVELHVNELLERLIELSGSDLHLTVGLNPSVRVHGEIRQLTEFPPLNGSEIRRMVYAILTQKQRERFEAELELDTSHSIPNVGRFRVNVFLQRDSVGAVMRAIPHEVVPFDRLGLPASVRQLAELPRGLVLVTGPTGSGKSTTLASLVDSINASKALHIMTVEDPIEFLHNHKRSVINQREVGEDTRSFASALKHVLRQDPDVILVGEMRDLDTIGTALTAAETGHLVFATLHTQDAPQSIDRIIDVFPSGQQQQVRVQLAAALQGVITQQLLPVRAGSGRTIAAEVLIATPAIRNMIRDGKTHQIYSAMQAGGKYGMQTMDQSLAELVKKQKITMEVALEKCANEEDLRRQAGE